MFLVAFAFSINLFPIYSGLKVKTNENCNRTVSVSISLIGALYSFLSIPALFLFGRRIDILNGNIMNNINEEYKIDPKHWEAFVLRFLFMCVLACHIPFIFFSGKEGLLIIIDELDRKSISLTLEERSRALLQAERDIIA